MKPCGGIPLTMRLAGIVFVVAVATPPASAQVPLPPDSADVPLFDVGSTFDALWTPGRPGDMTLRIVTTFNAGLTVFPGDGPPPHTMDIPVRIW